MSFQGKERSAIDANGRVSLPALFRKVVPTEKKFFLTPAEENFGDNGKHKVLHLRRESDFNDFKERILELPKTPNNYYIRSIVLGNSFEITLDDKQSRFLLNPTLKKYANIDKDILFRGDGNKIVMSNADTSEHLDLNDNIDLSGMEWL